MAQERIEPCTEWRDMFPKYVMFGVTERAYSAHIARCRQCQVKQPPTSPWKRLVRVFEALSRSFRGDRGRK